MLKSEALFLISLFVFFIIYLACTQKIYSHNNFTSFLIFAVIFPVLLIAFNLSQSKENLLKIASFGSIFLIYYVLIILLKKNYKKLNGFLIQKNWINRKYANKDFTFVHWDGDAAIPDYWDEKLAFSPSWFDKILTLLLLLLPIIFIGLVYKAIEAF